MTMTLSTMTMVADWTSRITVTDLDTLIKISYRQSLDNKDCHGYSDTSMDTLTEVAFILTIPGQPRIVMATVTDMNTLTRVAFVLTIHGQPWMVTG